MNAKEPSKSASAEESKKTQYNDKSPIVLLPVTCVKRLAARAGVKRISADAIEDIQYVNLSFVSQVIHHAIILAQMQNRKTIQPSDVFYASNRMGKTVIGPY